MPGLRDVAPLIDALKATLEAYWRRLQDAIPPQDWNAVQTPGDLMPESFHYAWEETKEDGAFAPTEAQFKQLNERSRLVDRINAAVLA